MLNPKLFKPFHQLKKTQAPEHINGTKTAPEGKDFNAEKVSKEEKDSSEA